MPRTILALLTFCFSLAASGQGTAPPAPVAQPGPAPTDTGWPRSFSKDGATVVMYQPQVDTWKDFTKICFLSAVVVTPKGEEQPYYGVAAVKADTLVDHDAGTVLMTNLDSTCHFEGVAPDKTPALSALVTEALASRPYVAIALKRVLSYMHGKIKPPTVPVNLSPPTIYFSETPAILLSYMGPPQFQPIAGTSLSFAVNTNWLVIQETITSQYYLLNGTSWLTAPNPIGGPWTAASSLPADFFKLPAGSEWDSARKNIPGSPSAMIPMVFGNTQPSELILTNGTPTYSSIPGTGLMYVNNPVQPVFFELSTGAYFYLVAGRWFTASGLWGPWSAASANLPGDFSLIPPDSPVGFVLASVPGTQEAKEAVLLATVPHVQTIDISKAKVDVVYQGAPKFVAIEGTPMTYAINTGYQVIFASGKYYCCYQGIWFVSGVATGPWAVCTAVPAVIYTIPPTCPVYNTTYVVVSSSTPTTVVVASSGGYSGEYVAATGALMFGMGMLTGAMLANNSCCNSCYYSYGCGATYHSYYGTYCNSGSYHGPYGGAGYHAQYNSATGTYSRGGYAYGPNGAASYHQAYNPYTDTYGAHASTVSRYGSSGATTVSQGDSWASAAHTTNSAGVTHGWAENSSGQSAQWAHAGNTGAATSSNGNMYASHDGTVYKNTGSGWQSNSGSGWNDVQKPTTSSASSQWQNRSTTSTSSWQHPSGSSASSWGGSGGSSGWDSSNWKSSWQNSAQQKSSSGGGWGSHDSQNSLNSDAWSRGSGNSWQSRSSSSDRGWGGHSGGGGGWGGFHGGGGGWGGGGGGGRFGGRR